ncbi:MAG TPA: hypothetical protein PLZ08_00110 [Bacillota bacterium]|nr:hypothetical protein [Bacillota bacterium]HOL08752.1 hypothetical protein [Bacillota bacterium]HPO96345.1 hypothetical protein [Bacillota bacterium]
MGDKVDYLNQLIFMLQEQLQGNKESVAAISKFIKPLFAEKVFREPTLTSEQVSAIEIIMREWRGMTSFEPGCLEGIPKLLSLLKWVQYQQRIDLLAIYKRDEWKAIVQLRGPVESVLKKRCTKCNTHYFSMGVSGFLDIFSLICSECGNVYFKSVYSESEPPSCECGGTYKNACPKCGELKGSIIAEISPYQYFKDHQYIRSED